MNDVNTATLKLVVVSELGLGDEYSISDDKRIIIGRGETANIQLSDDHLSSREHCEIFFKDSHFVINDLGSSNGTQLNNEDIDTLNISNGDVIGIGSTLFRVKVDVHTVEVKTENSTEMEMLNQQQLVDNETTSINETTITFKSSPNAPPKQVFSLFIEEKEEPSPIIDNNSSFKVEILSWQDQDGSSKLSVIAKNTFEMIPDKEPELSSKSIPIFKQTYFYDDKDHGSVLYESDLIPFKPLADIVIVGKAYTPNKQPQQTLDAGFQVGKTKKIIKVFGDRNWYQAEEDSDFVISEPLPFTTMDLKYEKSFGGSDLNNGLYFKQNPIGCGCIVEESLKDIKLRKLPNIENPQDLLESWSSRPDSVGFGFYANTWEPRIKYLGSYDEEISESDQLGLPKNFSYRFYNSAHPDLQVEDYLQGDERVELVNLSSKGRLVFNLPEIKPVVVVSKKNLNEENPNSGKSQIKMNLDTLVFIPDENVFYEVFRGVFQLDSLEDLQELSISVMENV